MLINEMHVRAIRAEKEREIAERQRAKQLPPRVRRSVRRSVGRSMISIGSRLASEPQTSRSQTASALGLARSR